jgi:hypothetical protein
MNQESKNTTTPIFAPNGEKYVSSDEIAKEYSRLSASKQVPILYEAIDIMQQYNGRSRFDCIAKAMGYSNMEGLNTTYFKKS